LLLGLLFTLTVATGVGEGVAVLVDIVPLGLQVPVEASSVHPVEQMIVTQFGSVKGHVMRKEVHVVAGAGWQMAYFRKNAAMIEAGSILFRVNSINPVFKRTLRFPLMKQQPPRRYKTLRLRMRGVATNRFQF
jgi:hypothetical protein